MKLSEYIKRQGISDKAFAEAVGLTPVTISKAKAGNIGRVTAKKIIDHTGGEVTYDDIYGESNETETLSKPAT